MLKKIIFTVSFILISLYGTAQKDINNYKYIIIPKKFEFSKSDDQYQLNSLAKFLFNKYGYEAYFVDEDLPEDLTNDRCLALTPEVSNEKSGMFKTKLEIILKDCYSTAVMTSQVGESRQKEYDKGYNEALRGAFETFQNLDYKYVSNQSETVETIENKVEIIKEKDEEHTKIKNEIEKVEEDVREMETKTLPTKQDTSEIHYAQAIINGFQLVNAEPKIVMILLNTAAKDIFIVKDKNAIVFKKEGKWLYSENDGTSTVLKELNIKF